MGRVQPQLASPLPLNVRQLLSPLPTSSELNIAVYMVARIERTCPEGGMEEDSEGVGGGDEGWLEFS